MKNKSSMYRVDVYQILLYAIVVIIVNAVSLLPRQLFLSVLVSLLGHTWYSGVIAYVSYVAIPLSLSWAVIFIFMKWIGVSKHYRANYRDKEWMNSGALLVLPAEVLRFLIATIGLNQLGSLSPVSHFFFGEIYLRFSGRFQAFYSGQSNIGDYVAGVICYLVYAAIHLFGVALIYRHFWFAGKREREDLIIHE